MSVESFRRQTVLELAELMRELWVLAETAGSRAVAGRRPGRNELASRD